MDEEGEIADLKDWTELEPSYPVKILLTIFYSLILVTGIVGNSVTIRVTQVLKRNGYLQKNVTDHMVSLACSDLLVLLIGMPVELYSAIWFPFTTAEGNASCKIYNFLFEACSYATILNVATLSFERYVAICHPFRFKALGGKRTSALITFAWLVSVLVALPLLVATGTQGHIPLKQELPVQNVTFCTNLREHWVMYRVSIFVAFIVYMVVLVCVAVMCRAMVLVLRRTLGSGDSGTNGVQTAPKHENSKIRRLMTAVPKSRWTTSYFRSYVTLHPVADSFFYLSSVINPFLYNLSSRQFREVFVQVLRCRLTLEHINKRTVRSTQAASARSIQPLLKKSLRRSRANRPTLALEKPPPTFTTFHSQSDSGVASNTQTSLSLTEESDLQTKTDVPSETEV
ncbi:hypothetical protein F7725_001506 [Dissostichus mawsoni]|uniref:G-protein coupled receptors family 1 profile domain-containing protein n=1 Tax=Dissostichus mawsoni TaxID=36200 RepID=A0A7J5Y1U5_DISMA|nr:hypothetical protein F7725_001506 [Dissostichus mawsoni]